MVRLPYKIYNLFNLPNINSCNKHINHYDCDGLGLYSGQKHLTLLVIIGTVYFHLILCLCLKEELKNCIIFGNIRFCLKILFQTKNDKMTTYIIEQNFCTYKYDSSVNDVDLGNTELKERWSLSTGSKPCVLIKTFYKNLLKL